MTTIREEQEVFLRDPEQDAVKIESFALEEEFVRLPGDLAFWNAKYSAVYHYWLSRKMILAQVTAEVSQAERTQLEGITGAKRVTISEVEAALVLNPEYQQAKVKEIEAEAEKVRLYGVLDAIRSKRDMLISLGAHMRAEMQSDPSIRRLTAIERERDNESAGRR